MKKFGFGLMRLPTLGEDRSRIDMEHFKKMADAFLAEHPDFSRESFILPAPVGETEGQLTLWPQRHDTDGFYICRLKRQN